MTHPSRTASVLALLVSLGGTPQALDAQSGDMAESMEPIILGYRTSIRSTVLDEDRPLLIYTPPGYEQSVDTYPVLYVLDGENHFRHVSGLTEFLSQEQIPEMIVVGVPNLPGRRTTDLGPSQRFGRYGERRNPTQSRASDFLSFLRDEVQPWVESHYRTAPFSVLVGHSMSGLFVIHVLKEDPWAFQGYISISPALVWDGGKFVTRADSIFAGRPDLKGALYLTMANEVGGYLAGGWSLASILETHAPESFRWNWKHMPEEGHGSLVHRSIYDGLTWMFDGWYVWGAFDIIRGRPLGEDWEEDWLELTEHYAGLSERLGFDVPVPYWFLDWTGNQLVQQRRFDEALVAYERNRELHPGTTSAFWRLGNLYRRLCRWDESLENYRNAFEVAQDLSYPNVDDYREQVARIAAEIESGTECTVPASFAEVEVAEHILERYVGEYEFMPGFFSLIVTLEDGTLFAQATGGQRRWWGKGKHPLAPESETTFLLQAISLSERQRVSSFRVSFTKDDAGLVTGIVLHQNRGDRTGRKVR